MDSNIDMVSVKSFTFHSVQSVMINKLETSSGQKSATLGYKVYMATITI